MPIILDGDGNDDQKLQFNEKIARRDKWDD